MSGCPEVMGLIAGARQLHGGCTLVELGNMRYHSPHHSVGEYWKCASVLTCKQGKTTIMALGF